MIVNRTWQHELECVGLKFRLKKPTRKLLCERIAKSSLSDLRLQREPENPYDENAIMVLAPANYMHGAHLGYLHREAAELLAPRLDNGSLEVVSVRAEYMDKTDELNTIQLVVRFRDLKRPAQKGKVAKGKAA